MTAATLTLAEFLLARIAEDEAMAREASTEAADPSGHWEFARYDYEGIWCTEPGRAAKDASADETWPECVHATRWDPARVIADCEAKRRIMERACAVLDSWEHIHEGHPSLAPYPDVNRREKSHAGSALRDMAAIYADHPDYREEWRP